MSLDLYGTKLVELIENYHKVCRVPVSGEVFEDLLDQAINNTSSADNWKKQHNTSVDVVAVNTQVRYQIKSAVISYNSLTSLFELRWSGYRSTSYGTIDEKVEHFDSREFDKYLIIAKDEKFKFGKRAYKLFEFDKSLIEYKHLEWMETDTGWEGVNKTLPYKATINKKMSDQLWTTCTDTTYVGIPYTIDVSFVNHKFFTVK
jgi:hypothetical protein